MKNIVGCFVEYNGKFVILLRANNKPQGYTWALPGGKIEANETCLDAIIREVEEEIGYKAKKSEIEFIGVWPFGNIMYHTFRIQLKQPIDVKLNQEEHTAFRWVTPEECYNIHNLIPGFHRLLELVGYIKKPQQ